MPTISIPKAPKYRKHSKGYAFVRVQKRDYYLGEYGSEESKERYERIIAEYLERQRLAGEVGRPAKLDSPLAKSDITVNEVLLRYFKEYADVYYLKDGKPTSEIVNLRHAVRSLRLLYGHIEAKEFGPLALKRVRQLMVDGWEYVDKEGNKRQIKRCRTVANKDTSRIRSIFRWAAENEILPVTVYQALTTLAPLKRGRCNANEPQPVQPVPLEDVEKVLTKVAPQVASMIRLQLLTGARPGEIASIRPKDVAINLEGVWVYTPERHKTEHHGKTRKIFVGPQAQAILRPFLNRDSDAYCFSPAEAEEARNRLKRANRRSPMTPSQSKRNASRKSSGRARDHYDHTAYRKAVRRACESLNVPVWHPNQLRHTRATDLRAKFGIEAAKTVLGHSELSTTEIYAERDFSTAAKIMAEVG